MKIERLLRTFASPFADGSKAVQVNIDTTPPVTTDGHPGRVGGFGMQIVERLADWGWRQSRSSNQTAASRRRDFRR